MLPVYCMLLILLTASAVQSENKARALCMRELATFLNNNCMNLYGDPENYRSYSNEEVKSHGGSIKHPRNQGHVLKYLTERQNLVVHCCKQSCPMDELLKYC